MKFWIYFKLIDNNFYILVPFIIDFEKDMFIISNSD